MAQTPTKISTRVEDIANALRSACIGISDDQDRMLANLDERNALATSLQNTRLAIAEKVAVLSSSGQWTAAEIESATKHAAKATNNDQDRTWKSVATLISEMRSVAHPKVREQFSDLLHICQAAWDDEIARKAEADSDEKDSVDMPIHKWQSRFYHLVMQVCRAVRKGEVEIYDTADLVAYARDNDPDFDPKKISDRIEAMRKALLAIHRDFGHQSLQDCFDYLADLDADKLKASRRQMLAAREAQEETRLQGHKLAPLPAAKSAPKITTVVTPQAQASKPEPAVEGVVDISDMDEDISLVA